MPRAAPAIQRGAVVSTPAGSLSALHLARLAALSGGSLLLAMAILFAVRRLSGDAHQPLTAEIRLIAALVLATTATLLRLPWIAPATNADRLPRFVGLLLPLTSLVLFGLALSLPAAPVWSVVVMWLSVAAHECVWGVGVFRGRTFRRRPTAALRTAEPRVQPRVAPTERAADAEAPPANVTQQIVRSREGAAEKITGVLRADLAVGERTCSLHVAFCPPLAAAPTIQCEQIDGPAATISLGEVQSYGARFDVRLLRAAAQPATVAVEFYAHT